MRSRIGLAVLTQLLFLVALPIVARVAAFQKVPPGPAPHAPLFEAFLSGEKTAYPRVQHLEPRK